MSRVHFRQGLGLAMCRKLRLVKAGCGGKASQGLASVLREGVMATRLGHLGEIQPQCAPPTATSLLATGSSPRAPSNPTVTFISVLSHCQEQ